MDTIKKFHEECTCEVAAQGSSHEAASLSQNWIGLPVLHHYSYHFSWLGRPVIQYPQDMMGMQEIIFSVQPDLIIETGIAHGGSLVFYASLLELNALCGGPQHAHVLGIDIDIRAHNRKAIEAHPMYARGRISMIEGSSIAPATVAQVKSFAAPYTRIMVLLDSSHTHAHVCAELDAYASLVTPASYCVVFDTIIERMPEDAYPDRPWGRGNNPMTAVDSFLAGHPEFEIDAQMDAKLLISVAPRGYLRRISGVA